jgi:hypothetical protein
MSLGWVVAFEFQTVVSSTSVGRRDSPDIRGHDFWNHMSPKWTTVQSLLLFDMTNMIPSAVAQTHIFVAGWLVVEHYSSGACSGAQMRGRSSTSFRPSYTCRQDITRIALVFRRLAR